MTLIDTIVNFLARLFGRKPVQATVTHGDIEAQRRRELLNWLSRGADVPRTYFD